MEGLSSDLHQRCRNILSHCRQFDDNDLLRTIFTTSELALYQDGLPEANRKDDRISQTIDYLLPKKLEDGRAVFPLFLAELVRRHPEGDALRNELAQLRTDIVEQELKELESKLANAQVEVEHKTTELQTLKTEFSQQQERCEALETELDTAKAEVEHTTTELQTLKTERRSKMKPLYLIIVCLVVGVTGGGIGWIIRQQSATDPSADSNPTIPPQPNIELVAVNPQTGGEIIATLEITTPEDSSIKTLDFDPEVDETGEPTNQEGKTAVKITYTTPGRRTVRITDTTELDPVEIDLPKVEIPQLDPKKEQPESETEGVEASNASLVAVGFKALTLKMDGTIYANLEAEFSEGEVKQGESIRLKIDGRPDISSDKANVKGDRKVEYTIPYKHSRPEAEYGPYTVIFELESGRDAKAKIYLPDLKSIPLPRLYLTKIDLLKTAERREKGKSGIHAGLEVHIPNEKGEYPGSNEKRENLGGKRIHLVAVNPEEGVAFLDSPNRDQVVDVTDADGKANYSLVYISGMDNDLTLHVYQGENKEQKLMDTNLHLPDIPWLPPLHINLEFPGLKNRGFSLPTVWAGGKERQAVGDTFTIPIPELQAQKERVSIKIDLPEPPDRRRTLEVQVKSFYDDKPILGATVHVEGQQLLTDKNGIFTIEVNASSVDIPIRVEREGYEAYDEPVKNQTGVQPVEIYPHLYVNVSKYEIVSSGAVYKQARKFQFFTRVTDPGGTVREVLGEFDFGSKHVIFLSSPSHLPKGIKKLWIQHKQDTVISTEMSNGQVIEYKREYEVRTRRGK